MSVPVPEVLKSPATNPRALAPILDMSESSVYNSIRTGTFPFPHLRIGGRIVIPTAPIREALGFTDDRPAGVAR